MNGNQTLRKFSVGSVLQKFFRIFAIAHDKNYERYKKKIDGCSEEIVLTVLILMCDQVAESDWEFAGMPESELGTQFPSSKLPVPSLP